MFHQNISFAGAGKVATALCRKMYETGIKVDLIVSLSEENGRALAGSCEASWSPVLNYPSSTDIIIVAVPDHNLRSVLEKINCQAGTLVAHTAGSIGLDVFPEHLSGKGVFYPLQTFSGERKVDFSDLPFLLESSDIRSSAILEELTGAIGGKTYFVSTEQRIMLHLAAVFICNFTNHMLTGGKMIAEKTTVPFEIFYPLLQETVAKAMDLGPEKSQTGPALRNDQNTIERHMELLSFSPEWKKIYNEITKSIINYYNKF
jgi:predicted short-subunit dehydrogenase-like oxidoreductase (DUF2520 family)